jgi:uncharacterized protein
MIRCLVVVRSACAGALLLTLVAQSSGGVDRLEARHAADSRDLIAVELATVGFDRGSESPVVLLREPESGRVVPIWVGPAEAQAILLALHGVQMPRPMTHDLMASLLGELRATVEEVVVHELRGNTFYGGVRLRVQGEETLREVDSRPSDALALALRTDARIRVARGMLMDPPEFDFVAPEDGEQVVHAAGVTVVATRPELRERFSLPDRPGLVVTHVFGRAREEGLRRGDLIVALDGNEVRAPIDFLAAVRATRPGTTVGLTIWREGEEQQIDLPVDAPPGRPGTRIVV